MIETRSVHEQLIQLCQEQLANGEYAVGDQFPSERELAKKHGISRATANKVLAKLVSEGWIEHRRGLGSFVANRPTLFASMRNIESFTDFASKQGFKPKTEVPHFEKCAEIDAVVQRALKVDAKASVIYVQRLRFADRDVVIYEERWLPSKRYPRLSQKLLEGSFYQLSYERYGLVVEREEAEVCASLLPQDAPVKWDCPALCVEGVGYDANHAPLWYQRLYYHGKRFALLNITEKAAAFPQLSLKLT